MTVELDIKKNVGPPPVPPRHDKEYYQQQNILSQKSDLSNSLPNTTNNEPTTVDGNTSILNTTVNKTSSLPLTTRRSSSFANTNPDLSLSSISLSKGVSLSSTSSSPTKLDNNALTETKSEMSEPINQNMNNILLTSPPAAPRRISSKYIGPNEHKMSADIVSSSANVNHQLSPLSEIEKSDTNNTRNTNATLVDPPTIVSAEPVINRKDTSSTLIKEQENEEITNEVSLEEEIMNEMNQMHLQLEENEVEKESNKPATLITKNENEKEREVKMEDHHSDSNSSFYDAEEDGIEFTAKTNKNTEKSTEEVSEKDKVITETQNEEEQASMKNESVHSEEVEALKQREKTQSEFVIKEQERLNDLHKKQYAMLQQQYSLAIQQKKQYEKIAASNNNADKTTNNNNNNISEQQIAILKQHEQDTISLQQNQNSLAQEVARQQQSVSDALSVHATIVKKLINLTGEPVEKYMIQNLPAFNINQPVPPQPPRQSSMHSAQSIPTPPQSQPSQSSQQAQTSNPPPQQQSGHLPPISPLQSPQIIMSPNLSQPQVNPNGQAPSQQQLAVPSPLMSPSMSPSLSPAMNNSYYYDEGVYSVSGFSIASNNSSVSEGIETNSMATDQIQQFINRRPTFQKNNMNKKIRICGSSQTAFQQTLNAYRQNVKKTSDPALQFEYSKFLIEAANDQFDDTTDSNKKHKNDLFDEGYKFLKKLSHAGYPDAQHYLATWYKQDNDWDKAYPLFLQAAKHNHPISSYEIASYYESKKNYKKASQYYKKSASQGYPLAMHRLGMAALKGEMHMRKDVKNAVKWLKRAAATSTREKNSAASAYELSNLYEKGMPPVIYSDELYALELLVQAAELDYPPAQFKLGWCFEYGELGCPTDAVQSIHWFLLAAENNEPNAQFSLAGWYLTGAEGIIEPNDGEAFHWAKKAAEQKFVKAEYAVAYFYEMGIGIEKNLENAMKWYKIAADHGDQRAIQRLENEKTGKKNEKSTNDCKIS